MLHSVHHLIDLYLVHPTTSIARGGGEEQSQSRRCVAGLTSSNRWLCMKREQFRTKSRFARTKFCYEPLLYHRSTPSSPVSFEQSPSLRRSPSSVAGVGKAFVQMNIDKYPDPKNFISKNVDLRYPVCIPVNARNIPEPLPDSGFLTGYRHWWTCYTGEGNKREPPFLFTGALPARVEIA